MTPVISVNKITTQIHISNDNENEGLKYILLPHTYLCLQDYANKITYFVLILSLHSHEFIPKVVLHELQLPR